MNIKQLEAFQSVMIFGSTKAAAENLMTSQSGISRLLTQLELDLGLELFSRHKGRLIPKPEAEELLLSISDIMDKVNQLSRQADEIRLGRFSRRLIKIAIPYTLALNFTGDPGPGAGTNATEEWSFPPVTAAILTEGSIFLSGGTTLRKSWKITHILSLR